MERPSLCSRNWRLAFIVEPPVLRNVICLVSEPHDFYNRHDQYNLTHSAITYESIATWLRSTKNRGSIIVTTIII